MVNSTEERRSGRRPGAPATRDAILAAAKEAFTAAGYRGATIRGIAASAGVDPALVMHFFGNKEALFAEAMRPPFEPAAVLASALAEDPARAGERVARFFLSAWDEDSHRHTLLGLVRSAVTEPTAAAMVKQGVIGPVRDVLDKAGADQPELRASLVASQLMGLAVGRYMVQLARLAEAPRETVVRAVAPVLQRYINGDITKGEGHD